MSFCLRLGWGRLRGIRLRRVEDFYEFGAYLGGCPTTADIDTGPIIAGETTIEKMGDTIFERVIPVASGDNLGPRRRF